MSDKLKDAMGTLMDKARTVMEAGDRKATYQALMAKQQSTLMRGSANNNMVTVQVNLQFDVIDLQLAPAFFECGPEAAAGYVKEALNEALNLAKKESAAQMTEIMQLMGMGK